MPSIVMGAPVGGWNARDSLSEMPPTDAVELVNIIPRGDSVRTRPGHAEFSDDLSGEVETLVTFHGTTEKLICAANSKLINITAGGTGTTLGTGFSNDRWQTCEFNRRMIFCNGEDTVRDWDGTTLTNTNLYGPNLVSNGTFDTDTLWTKGTGWTISGMTASSDGSQASDSDLTQTPTTALVNGQDYIVTFTVSNRSAGSVVAVVGDTEGTDRSADGTYTETITAGAGTDFDIRADANFVGDIDLVSIGRTSENFIAATVHQGRVYYIEKDSQSFFYAGASSYAGETSEFDLGTIAGTNANLLFMVPWSRDSGAGMDDLAAFVFADGTVVVYSGTDPGSASAWSLVGVYKTGNPLGRRAWARMGGDVILFTKDGYIPLSAILAEGRYSEQSAFSFKIDRAAKDAAQTWGSNYGWSAEHFPEGSLFVVNVPISSTESQQHVRNTTTGAWCKFTGLAATQFAVYDGKLYFGSQDGYVYRVSGSSDNGAYINFKCVQAYTHFGDPGNKKKVTAVQAQTNYNLPKYFDHRFFADFNEKTLPAISDPPESAASEWNVAEWNVAVWNQAGPETTVARKNVHGHGFFLAHVFRFKSRAQAVTWWATQIILKPSGII